jgi:small neutral amino acid transporter SnatA (MarC family)
VNEFTRALFALVVASAVLGALPLFAAYLREVGPQMRVRGAIAAGVLAFGMLGGAIAIGDTFLDWIDVTPENFQMAAAIVMGPVAIRMLIAGDAMTTPEEAGGPVPARAWLVPVVFPLIAGPAALAAAISYATRFGEGETLGAAAIAAGVAAAVCAGAPWLYSRLGGVVVGALGRLNGAVLLVVAVELMVDGIRSV